MNGRTCFLLICLLTILAAGCGDVPQMDAPKPEPIALAAAFDPATAGTISGQVVWQGDVPQVPAFRAPVNPSGEAAVGPKHAWVNPNAPIIDAQSRGVAGAVVFLRAVDPQRSRPWDWPRVRVEMRDYEYHVMQGGADTRTGFVRRGEAVEFISLQGVFHSLRARGDAFFTLAFPDAAQPRARIFDRPGVVELSSAAGYFWARAHLFVVEHPYYARTDGAGRFTLPQVPPGDYEVVCWLPSWHVKEHELDADSWQVSRLTFKPPVEETQKVRVAPGRTTGARIALSAVRFGP